jgi:hypothetical protein
MERRLNILDLVYSDTFCEIQAYLDLRDYFNLRCVSVEFRDYFDIEITKLKSVILPKAHAKTVNPFKVLCEKCLNLETINLSHNDWLTDDLLSKLLIKNSKTLKSLNLNFCLKLTSVALQPVVIVGKNLTKLSLHSCSWLSVGCIEAIAFHHENIEELDISACIISERCLVILLNKFRLLRVLSLSSVTTVNDNILFNISLFLKYITHLNLFGCVQITDRGIGALSLNCKSLESLSIRGCSVTERSLNILRERNVHIDIPRTTYCNFMENFRRQQMSQQMVMN